MEGTGHDRVNLRGTRFPSLQLNHIPKPLQASDLYDLYPVLKFKDKACNLSESYLTSLISGPEAWDPFFDRQIHSFPAALA